MIINAEGLIAGKIAAYAAKQALLGEKVDIINAEKACITGSKKNLLENYAAKVKRGNPFKGPYFPTTPDRILRRTVRGMLPWKIHRGKDAYKRVMCYLGVPDGLQGKEVITLKQADIAKTKSLRYLTLAELSILLRGNPHYGKSYNGKA